MPTDIIYNCPICDAPLEGALQDISSCFKCRVTVDHITGEITRMGRQRGIVKINSIKVDENPECNIDPTLL